MSYCSVPAVLALFGSTKKHFGHYAILKILSLRPPRELRFLLARNSLIVVHVLFSVKGINPKHLGPLLIV